MLCNTSRVLVMNHVTHSMTQSKSTSDDVTTNVDLDDTFLSRVINDDNVLDVTNDDFSAKPQACFMFVC